ncbi:MAG: hypothetical protein J7623_01690 [Chitinophaga sp.]|uniref:S41 family peptidase n=1 Tax=Chitinophaga sp. TaxID=1869181 RepID=UPI001AFFC089|nr:S41 family peptidase [Chitinophaga sp.]MBO9727328.1 hypothetical protein [Chitinophaga sp.]
MISLRRCIFLLLIAFSATAQQPPDQLYPPAALKADFRFLRKQLETIHPALYRYTSRQVFSAFCDSLYHEINHPMKEQAFLSLITLLHEKIADGHTMFLPSEAAMAYYSSKGRFLPLLVTCRDGKLFIRDNGSLNKALQAGQEILSINDMPTDSLMTQLVKRQIRDGYNQTYPLWILQHYFSAYYNFAFGQCPSFRVQIKGAADTQTVAALTKDSIRLLLTPDTTAEATVLYPHGNENPGITLSTMPDEKPLAWLKVKTLDKDQLKATHHQSYKTAIDSIFATIRDSGYQHLVLDLRDNQGGDFAPGCYLLSYLVPRPVTYLYGGKETRLITPVRNRYTGRLFVLINGGTFSNAAIVSAYLEKYTRAIFIGTESGGNKHIISGNARAISLPNTHLQGFISTTNYLVNRDVNDGHGVMPQYNHVEEEDAVKKVLVAVMAGE